MVSSPILLDFQSSTPCLKEVVEEMSSYWTVSYTHLTLPTSVTV